MAQRPTVTGKPRAKSAPSNRLALRLVDRVTVQIDLAKCIYATACLVGAVKSPSVIGALAKIIGGP